MMAFVMVVMMTVALMSSVNVFAADIVDSGTCDENLTWTLDSTGKLTISGTGEMPEFDGSCSAPWYVDWNSIKKVVIEDGVTSISDWAFSYCISLTSITIPDSVISIGESAFDSCSVLTEINVDENNNYYSSVGGVLFSKDKKTLNAYPAGKTSSSYVIPNGVTIIGNDAFNHCTGLKSITIPDSVTCIGNYALYGCTGLKSIKIPDSVTSIGYWAFGDCTSLTSITIPDRVTMIDDYAFCGCTGLKSVTIGNSVRGIGDNAFSGCTSLKSVTIGNSVTRIGDYAFYGCTGLTSITIPKSVTNLGEQACGYYYDDDAESYVKVNNFTIYGYSGTAIERYARKDNFQFIDLYTHAHSYKSAVIKKANCTANGAIKYTCLCGDSYTKIIRATGHKCKTTTAKANFSKDGLTITKCTVCGAIKSKTSIASVKTISLSKTALTYNGKTQRPSVVVKDRTGKVLKNGTDYTVKYSSGCKNVGQYTVTVTFKGKYSGTKTLTFKIVPKGTSISKLTAGKKQFTAKWSAQTAQTTGYELQYSTKSSMSGAKTVTVKKNKTTSAKVKKLKGKKKYYARVRTYKLVKINGKNVKLYSSWSKVKSVKLR